MAKGKRQAADAPVIVVEGAAPQQDFVPQGAELVDEVASSVIRKLARNSKKKELWLLQVPRNVRMLRCCRCCLQHGRGFVCMGS